MSAPLKPPTFCTTCSGPLSPWVRNGEFLNATCAPCNMTFYEDAGLYDLAAKGIETGGLHDVCNQNPPAGVYEGQDMIDLKKYEGRTQYDWILVDLRTLDGDYRREEISICFQSGADAVGVTGGTIARIRNVLSGLPLNDEDEANARLIADAPKLLAEVVKQRTDIAELVRVLQAIEHAQRMGFQANEILDENSTIRDELRAALSKHGGEA